MTTTSDRRLTMASETQRKLTLQIGAINRTLRVLDRRVKEHRTAAHGASEAYDVPEARWNHGQADAYEYAAYLLRRETGIE